MEKCPMDRRSRRNPMQLKVDGRVLDLVDVATAKEVEGLANRTKIWTIVNELTNHG